MVRLLSTVWSIALTASPDVLAANDSLARTHFVTGIDLSYVNASGLSSWTEGSVGKLRYDDSSDGLVISRAFLDAGARLTDTLDLNATLQFCDDDLGAALDFTEAYAEWRPVPRSANRYRVKVGAFYPVISMENTGPGWSSPYTISSSTINTWIAEEVRTVGAELSWSRRPQALGGAHRFAVQAAVFGVNDPSGSLLAWKGWSADDRQSRFGDALPLPPLPQIQPGMMFEDQDPYVVPFREVDGRVGYYLNGEWRMGNRFTLSAMTYNNRADPEAIEDGQYAWYTEFNHLGGSLSLPGGIGVISQWLRGSTVMGRVMNGAHVVDAGFDSKYLLLTKTLDSHRFSVRYDNFEVTENDDTSEDSNDERGLAWTLAYRYSHSDTVLFAAEWLSIKTHHDGWVYYAIEPTATEQRLQLSIMLRFAR
ncbi:MAG: hypothetical protein OEV41_00460 [Gammaproteobacteria bacterium]|nr:hypothetical protein [Gammaproteobacteria bacterium]